MRINRYEKLGSLITRFSGGGALRLEKIQPVKRTESGLIRSLPLETANVSFRLLDEPNLFALSVCTSNFPNRLRVPDNEIQTAPSYIIPFDSNLNAI